MLTNNSGVNRSMDRHEVLFEGTCSLWRCQRCWNGPTARISRWLIDSFPSRRFSQLEILPRTLYWSLFSDAKMVKQVVSSLLFTFGQKKKEAGEEKCKRHQCLWTQGQFLWCVPVIFKILLRFYPVEKLLAWFQVDGEKNKTKQQIFSVCDAVNLYWTLSVLSLSAFRPPQWR